MEQMNKVTLVGVVGSIAQCNDISTRFSVATNYAYRCVDGSAMIETTWHNVVHLKKVGLKIGDYVRIEGRIKNGRYTNSDGMELHFTEIVARSVEILKEQPTIQMA